MSAQSASPSHKQGAQLTREVQARIGHQLRAIYDDVVRQGVPDRFADLIRKLDAPGQDAAPVPAKNNQQEG